MFNPTLSGGVAFNNPVEQPNAMATVANLFDSLMSNGMPKKETRQSTADERFAADLRSFMQTKPAATKWDAKTQREFIFRFPQHASQVKTFTEGVGGSMVDPRDAAVQEGFNTYIKDPAVQVAAFEATNMTPEAGEAHVQAAIAKSAQKAAALKEIDYSKATKTQKWEVIAPSMKDFADGFVTSALGSVFQSVKNGQPVTLTPEQKARLGVSFDRVDMNNMPQVLLETRNYLSKVIRQQYADAFQSDPGLIPEDLEKRMLASIDSLIKVTEQFDSPSEVASNLNALTEAQVWRKAEAVGLNGAIYLMKTLPPEVLPKVLADPGIQERVGRFVLDEINGNEKPVEEVSKSVQGASVEDAKKLTTDLARLPPATQGMFAGFVEATRRSGYQAVDGATFKNLVTNRNAWLTKEVDADPAFREYAQNFFMSDIQATITLIRRNLTPGTSLSYQGGRFTIIQESIELPSDFRMGGKTAVETAAERQVGGFTVDDLNGKMNALKTLKGFGKEITDAVIEMELGAPPPGRVGGQGDDSLKGSAGNDLLTPASLIRTESGGNFKAKNDVEGAGGKGHFGRLQFSQGRLNEAKAAGVMPRGMTPQEFLNSPETQVQVERWHFKDIQKFAESNDLTKFIGQTIKGVPVTFDGILAVAHLGGKGGLKKFLESGGKYNPADAFGTSLLDYLRTHQGSTGGFAPGAPEEAAPTINVEAMLPTVDAREVGSGSPQEVRTAAFELPGTTPTQEAPTAATGPSPETVERIRELLSAKTVDPEIKALIEALIGGKNA